MNAISKHLQKLLKKVFTTVSLTFALCGVLVISTRVSHAQLAVVCANCAQVTTQLTQYAEQLTQYAKQVQQYELQLQQYQNMLKNTISLPNAVFDNALSTIRGIETGMNSGSNIRYTMPNLDTAFNKLYPGVYGHIQELAGISQHQALSNDYLRNQEAYDAAQTALKAAQAQSHDLTDDQWRMDMAGSDLLGASGNLDGLQSAAEYAQMTAQQVMKMRQLGLVQIQMQSVQAANQARKEDLRRAALDLWTEPKAATPTSTARTSDSF